MNANVHIIMIRYILAFHYIYNDAWYVWIWIPSINTIT